MLGVRVVPERTERWDDVIAFGSVVKTLETGRR
jgi:hypothetical protein